MTKKQESQDNIPEEYQKQKPEQHRTKLAKGKFLKAYALRSTISEACRLSGVALPTFYHWLKKDPTWAGQLEQARTQIIEQAETELYRRARLKKPGERDTTALIFWLKKNFPDKYEDFTRIKFVTNEDLIRAFASLIAEHVTDPEVYNRIRAGLAKIAASG